MDELVVWLRGVLAEDEALVRRNLGDDGLGDSGSFPDYRTYDGEDLRAADAYLERFRPPILLADIEAKRAILDRYTEVHGQVLDALAVGDVDAAPTATEHSYATVVRLLASAYRNRPGYREEWRP